MSFACPMQGIVLLRGGTGLHRWQCHLKQCQQPREGRVTARHVQAQPQIGDLGPSNSLTELCGSKNPSRIQRLGQEDGPGKWASTDTCRSQWVMLLGCAGWTIMPMCSVGRCQELVEYSPQKGQLPFPPKADIQEQLCNSFC